MTRIGAIFSPYTHTPEQFREAVTAVEAAGIGELWIWEDCFRQSAFATATAALSWTENLKIGIGIAPMPLRNVAATAMEIATIERLFPGRLIPGVGHGVQDWMAQAGARVASPLTLMREYVPALRSLLAGDEVNVEGRYVRLRGVRLEQPPEVAPPVFASAEGPKTLRLSGEVADGTVLDSRHTPAEWAASIEAIRAGRADAQREGDPAIVGFLRAGFGADAEAQVLDGLKEFDDREERAVWGDPAEVASRVLDFSAAGVDAVILQPDASVDVAEYYAAIGEVARIVAG